MEVLVENGANNTVLVHVDTELFVEKIVHMSPFATAAFGQSQEHTASKIHVFLHGLHFRFSECFGGCAEDDNVMSFQLLNGDFLFVDLDAAELLQLPVE